MKLWFKIFICTLLLVIVSIYTTATAVILQNQNTAVEREKSQALSAHEYMCVNILNNITYERLKTNAVVLNQDEINKTIKDIFSENFENSEGAAVVFDGKTIASYGSIENGYNQIASKIPDTETAASIILDSGGKTFIYVGSMIELEDYTYNIYTSKDITVIYDEFDKELQYIQIMSVIFACITAAILLIIVKLLLLPLNRINRQINIIADGNYDLKLKVKGSDEFKKLSQNINIMSHSVAENYHRIETIADDRKRFIDSLSHEMKTPLTSILGFADILRITRNLPEEKRSEYLTIIVEETKRLRSLSGKLMELVASESTEIDLKPVKVEEVLDSICTVFSPTLAKRHITIEYIPQSVTVMADEELFKSLIYNLVDNAIKASYDNSRLVLSCHKDGSNAVITVQDFGIGISKEDKEKIFEPFYMADKARSRSFGGAGIGLALCADIARKHNAKLNVTSELHKGTTVTVTLPSIKEEEHETSN